MFFFKHLLYCYVFAVFICTGKANSNLLPDTQTCGVVEEAKILGGKQADLHEFPWMALLQYQKPNGRDFNCGGTLISKRYVLTAAHCVRTIPSQWELISVRLGEHDLNKDNDCEMDEIADIENCISKPIDIPIEEAISHELYNPKVSDRSNDIALVRLSKDITFTEFIKPICLPNSLELMNKNLVGENVTIAGWGRTETASMSHVLLKLTMPVRNDTDCIEKYSNVNVKINTKQLCVGGIGGKDACNGDSGGPLMHMHDTNGEWNWYIFGVMSFGPSPCGINGWPGVYSKVPAYINWIVDNLKP